LSKKLILVFVTWCGCWVLEESFNNSEIENNFCDCLGEPGEEGEGEGIENVEVVEVLEEETPGDIGKSEPVGEEGEEQKRGEEGLELALSSLAAEFESVFNCFWGRRGGRELVEVQLMEWGKILELKVKEGLFEKSPDWEAVLKGWEGVFNWEEDCGEGGEELVSGGVVEGVVRVRCLWFWNQIWIERGDMSNSLASLPLYWVSGKRFFWKTSSKTALCCGLDLFLLFCWALEGFEVSCCIFILFFVFFRGILFEQDFFFFFFKLLCKGQNSRNESKGKKTK